MKALTREERAAIQSVRAKARKALAVDAPTTKAVDNHLAAVIAWADKALAPKAKPATKAAA